MYNIVLSTLRLLVTRVGQKQIFCLDEVQMLKYLEAIFRMGCFDPKVVKFPLLVNASLDR